ncbi:MAG: adenylate/guanylate cyclase domain-containing protein [Hyphomicrobiaceae bacterium]
MARYNGIEIPDNDVDRVMAVRSYGILHTEPEPEYDDIVELAAAITGCKIAYVSFFDEAFSRLKARYGIPLDRPDRPRELSLCSPTLCQSDMLIVPDLSMNPRYADLPAVTNPPHARFYCAMPLINPEGYALGTLCVWDPQVKTLTPEQQQCIRRLARQLLSLLEMRRALFQLREDHTLLETALHEADAGLEIRQSLLYDVFPEEIADQLVSNQPVRPRYFDTATVLFVDFANFSHIGEMLAPRDLIDQLDEYFSMFDRVMMKYSLVKIKTVGDAYLAVAGILQQRPDHAQRACQAALEIAELMEKANSTRRKLGLIEWPIRVGLHTGSLIAGKIGQSRATYDVWGDGVNVAKRVQEECELGRISISDATVGLASRQFKTESRGEIEVKNKGKVHMHYLLGTLN